MPRFALGATSAMYVGPTTVVIPIPRPAKKRPAISCPVLPWLVTTMMKPMSHKALRSWRVRTRPTRSQTKKASSEPTMLPSWTMLVMLERTSAWCDSEPSSRWNSSLKLCMLTMPPTRPSSRPRAAPRRPVLNKSVRKNDPS